MKATNRQSIKRIISQLEKISANESASVGIKEGKDDTYGDQILIKGNEHGLILLATELLKAVQSAEDSDKKQFFSFDATNSDWYKGADYNLQGFEVQNKQTLAPEVSTEGVGLNLSEPKPNPNWLFISVGLFIVFIFVVAFLVKLFFHVF